MNKDLYKTSNLSLASAINIFHPILEIDRTNPKECAFVFLITDDLQTIIDSFWDRTLTVTPMDYFQSLKVVKTRLYS